MSKMDKDSSGQREYQIRDVDYDLVVIGPGSAAFAAAMETNKQLGDQDARSS